MPEELRRRYQFHSLKCPFARGGRCIVWDYRPLTCRLFGVVQGLECPHGAVPERMLTPEQAGAIMRDYVTCFFDQQGE